MEYGQYANRQLIFPGRSSAPLSLLRNILHISFGCFISLRPMQPDSFQKGRLLKKA